MWRTVLCATLCVSNLFLYPYSLPVCPAYRACRVNAFGTGLKAARSRFRWLGGENSKLCRFFCFVWCESYNQVHHAPYRALADGWWDNVWCWWAYQLFFLCVTACLVVLLITLSHSLETIVIRTSSYPTSSLCRWLNVPTTDSTWLFKIFFSTKSIIFLQKVNVLVKKLQAPPLVANLAKQTGIAPKQRNATRWSSNFEMICCYRYLITFGSSNAQSWMTFLWALRKVATWPRSIKVWEIWTLSLIVFKKIVLQRWKYVLCLILWWQTVRRPRTVYLHQPPLCTVQHLSRPLLKYSWQRHQCWRMKSVMLRSLFSMKEVQALQKVLQLYRTTSEQFWNRKAVVLPRYPIQNHDFSSRLLILSNAFFQEWECLVWTSNVFASRRFGDRNVFAPQKRPLVCKSLRLSKMKNASAIPEKYYLLTKYLVSLSNCTCCAHCSICRDIYKYLNYLVRQWQSSNLEDESHLSFQSKVKTYLSKDRP